MKIAIMTDVNAGLDYVGYETGIPCLRSTVNFKDEVLVDGIDIKADEFYQRIKNITDPKDIPSTSAPAVGEIYDAIDRLISEGYTDIIHFPISFELSATGPTVLNLAKEYEGKINIQVFNTKGAAYIQGFMALNAKKMVDEGHTVEEILARSEYLRDHFQAFFVVDDLNYLVKNGRLSGAAGLMGSLLHIKPVLEINKDGKIVTKEKIKTHRRAVERIVELILDYIKDQSNVKVAVYHSLREDGAKDIISMIQSARPDLKEIEIHFITPAVGAHIGAGVLGISAFIL
jgi:DegV family protein with EDD domain